MKCNVPFRLQTIQMSKASPTSGVGVNIIQEVYPECYGALCPWHSKKGKCDRVEVIKLETKNNSRG